MYIDPTRAQFDVFKALPRDVPVNMLNLVLLHDEVTLEDGRTLSGAEAYKAYGAKSAAVFKKVGGEIVWRGEPQPELIGPSEEHWDIAFIARYPTVGAFWQMITDPAYAEALPLRQAAVADSRLIPMTDTESGNTFA
ncbi:MAG: DUF1330 domain-containing protein [Pseudomonadota bacterium]